MTVVHVYGAYVPTRTEGISANVHGLVEALRRAGAHARQDCEAVDLVSLNSRRALAASAVRGARRVRAAAADPATSLVHHHVSLLSTALPARAAHASSAGSRCPVLLHAWNAHFEPGSAPGLPRRDRLAHRLANGPEATALALRGVEDLVVSSRHQAAQVEALRFAGRIHVVPNGVDLDAHRPRSADEKDAARRAFGLDGGPVVLYYGHATPWKGVRALMAALPTLLDERPGAQALLSLTGYGADGRWVAHQVRSHGLEGRVKVVGPADVAQLHAAADLAVVPAAAAVGTACHPNVLLECMAGGVPVVASAVGSIQEVVQDGRNGRLAQPGHVADLAAGIGELAGDAGLRRRLAAEARRSMEDGFGWDAIAARMLDVYRSVGVEAVPRARPPRPSVAARTEAIATAGAP